MNAWFIIQIETVDMFDRQQNIYINIFCVSARDAVCHSAASALAAQSVRSRCHIYDSSQEKWILDKNTFELCICGRLKRFVVEFSYGSQSINTESLADDSCSQQFRSNHIQCVCARHLIVMRSAPLSAMQSGTFAEGKNLGKLPELHILQIAAINLIESTNKYITNCTRELLLTFFSLHLQRHSLNRRPMKPSAGLFWADTSNNLNKSHFLHK